MLISCFVLVLALNWISEGEASGWSSWSTLVSSFSSILLMMTVFFGSTYMQMSIYTEGMCIVFTFFFFNISRLVKAFLEFRCTIKHFSKDIVFICYFIRIQFKGWVHCHSFRKQLVTINFINSLRSSILISRFAGTICLYSLAFLHKFQ